MTGKETVNYLKANYTEGQDYAHITVVVRKREVQIHSPNEAMQTELKKMGFEINGWWATKSWPETEAKATTETETAETEDDYQPQLRISYTGMISLGLQVIGQGVWNEAKKDYEIPAGFQIPEWAK